jgi:phosphoribosylanthranilate isomerase
MPSGPGVISDDIIQKLAKNTPPGVSSFLLTSKRRVPDIIEQHKFCRTSTIQIVDSLLEGSYTDLKEALPGITIVQVIHVNDHEAIEEAILIDNEVDAILLDSGNQKLKIKELGGTGRTHNWEISKKLVESVKSPVYLAGGLNADNIVEAIKTVKPFGVDLCSGVRSNGKLDELKLNNFFKTVKNSTRYTIN